MKKTINLQLKMSEIIFDIQNKTYLTGRSISNGAPTSHIANMQANDDDENEAQILRSITSAVGVLRNRFAEYLEISGASSQNDPLNASDNINLSLNMPSNFNSSVNQTIGAAAHQFIVAYSITEWFAITAKGETSDYSAVAENSLAVLEEALCKRVRPSRLSSQ